jgi:hypothetical protein
VALRNLYGMEKIVKRLRISTGHADFLRAYSEAKGISETRAISNMIDNEIRRINKKRLRSPF